jgi:predicted ATPase
VTQPLLDQLKVSLQEKQLLLLLDNFEQVVAAAPSVADLLAACAGLKVLVTSRTVLHLRGEKEFTVLPLALPDQQQPASLDTLSHSAAVELLHARTLDVLPSFAITAENISAMVAICERLDGLPLAIELVASRMKVFSPQALLARLTNQLDLFTGGARDLPARQQTIRATIDWSYQLLTLEEQTLFAWLSVFVGGWTLDAAEAICVSATEAETAVGHDVDLYTPLFDVLGSLIDKNLVQRAVGVDHEPRFSMLETIWTYALERLDLQGEVDVLREQHAEYYLALVERAEPEFRGPQARMWMDRLEADYGNVRAVLTWSQVAPDRAEHGVRLAGALCWFWDQRSVAEGDTWLTRVLSYPETHVGPAARAKALTAASHFAVMQGNYERALACGQEALPLARQAGDPVRVAWALYQLGEGLRFRNNIVRSLPSLEESLMLFCASGDSYGIARTLFSLSQALYYQGQVVRAIVLQEESLALCREIGDLSGSADSLTQLGHIAWHQGDTSRAVACYDESLSLWREAGDQWGIATGLGCLGMMELKQGNWPRAATLLVESMVLFRDQGARRFVAWTQNNLGNLERARGDDASAAIYYDKSLAILQELGDEQGLAEVRCDMGILAYRQHQDARAIALFTESLPLLLRLGARRELADIFVSLAIIAEERRQFERAVRLFGAMEALYEALGRRLLPTLRADYDASVATVRNQLGEVTFSAAWAEGRAMSLEQVIAEALTGGH